MRVQVLLGRKDLQSWYSVPVVTWHPWVTSLHSRRQERRLVVYSTSSSDSRAFDPPPEVGIEDLNEGDNSFKVRGYLPAVQNYFYTSGSIASLLLPNGSIRVARSIILWSALRVFKKRKTRLFQKARLSKRNLALSSVKLSFTKDKCMRKMLVDSFSSSTDRAQ